MTDTIDLKLTSKGEYSVSTKKPFSFDGKILELLPKFYTEKILGTEQYRSLKFFNITEDIFNIVYTKLKKIYEIYDINSAHPRYVYQLGLLLGLTDLEDLTFSLDDVLIQKQRLYVKESADRYLLKGTPESIIRLFYGIAILVQLEDVWTRDYEEFVVNPDMFIKDFQLGVDYEGTYEDDSSYHAGYIYSDSYYIITEIEESLGTSSGITQITEYKTSDYSYNFIQTNNGLFFEDDNHLWFHYSVNTTKFKIYDNKVFVIDGSEFKAFHHLEPEITIFSIGCVWFDTITLNEIEYIVLDTGTQIQIRDINNYSIIGRVTKENSNSINTIVNLKEDVWVFFCEANKEYFIIDFSVANSPIIVKSSTSYSSLIPAGGYDFSLVDRDNSIIENIFDNYIYIFFISSGVLHKLSISFASDYSVTYSYLKIPTTLQSLVALKKIDESILFFLSENGIGIYDYINNTIKHEEVFHDEDTYEYKNFMLTNNFEIGEFATKYKITDSSNKVYLWKKQIGAEVYKPQSFYGFVLYDGKLFKTHYFNIKITSVFNNDTISTIKSLIETVKPAYTELKAIILEQDFDETFSLSDTFSIDLQYSDDLIFDGTQCINLNESGPHYFNGSQTADGSCDIFAYPLLFRAAQETDTIGGEIPLYYDGTEVYDGLNSVPLL